MKKITESHTLSILRNWREDIREGQILGDPYDPEYLILELEVVYLARDGKLVVSLANFTENFVDGHFLESFTLEEIDREVTKYPQFKKKCVELTCKWVD